MKRVDRIRQQLRAAQSAYANAFRDGMPTRAQAIYPKMKNLEALLAEAEEYEVKLLRDVLPEETMREDKMAESIAAIHLAMDCLIEITMDFRKKLQNRGLEASELCGKVKTLEKYANDILGDACKLKYDGLTRFITEDDELVDDMCKLVYDYVDKKLQPNGEE